MKYSWTDQQKICKNLAIRWNIQNILAQTTLSEMMSSVSECLEDISFRTKKVSRRKHLSSPFCMQDYIICILRSIEMPVLSQKYSRFTRIHRLCLGNTSSKPHKSAYSKYTSAIFIARSGCFLQGKYPLRNLWLLQKDTQVAKC